MVGGGEKVGSYGRRERARLRWRPQFQRETGGRRRGVKRGQKVSADRKGGKGLVAAAEHESRLCGRR